MASDGAASGDELLRQALESMESALELLDRAGAPAQIGAHLDLAICELRSALAEDRTVEATGVRPRLGR